MHLNWTKKSMSEFYTADGLHFRVSVCSWLPWALIHYSDDGKISDLSGHLSLMLKNTANFMGFNYTLVTPADGLWGAPGEGDNWTGMIGMLQRDEADFAMGPFAITYLRAQVVDYTMQFTSNYLTIMAGRLKGHHTSFFSYILTFGWEIWLGILLSWTFLVFFLTVSDVVHFSKWRSCDRATTRYMYHFWVFFSNIFCESSPNSPDFTSGRILVTVWWLALIVLMNGFSGNLKAMMMTDEEPERIDSIQDILSRKNLRPIIMKGTAYETYIKNTQTEEFQLLYKKVSETNGLLMDEMYTYKTLREVLRGERVIVNDYWSMSDALSRRCSNLTEGIFYYSKLKFFHHPFAVALNKRLPKELASELSKRITWIFESSVLSRWAALMNYNWDKCTAPDIFQEEKPLTLVDLEGFFILYLCVSAFCFVFLLMENTGRIVRLCKRCLCR